MQFPASGLSICNDFSLPSKPRDLYTNYLAFPPLPLFSLPLQGSILIFGSSSETACFISKTQLLRNLLQFLIIENLNFSVSIHKTFNHTLAYIRSVLLNIVSYVRGFSTFVVKSSDVSNHSHGISINEVDEYTQLFVFSKSIFVKNIKIIFISFKIDFFFFIQS